MRFHSPYDTSAVCHEAAVFERLHEELLASLSAQGPFHLEHAVIDGCSVRALVHEAFFRLPYGVIC
jgi:hypothetical protein